MTGKRFTWGCAACGKQTSVTAGTVMHRSHLPLKGWFAAIHIVTSHSNGIPALQLQAQLGLGSYKTAWLLLQKLRRLRRNDDPRAGGQERSARGKLFVAGSVELSPDGQPRRFRLASIAGFSAAVLQPFVATVAAPAPASSPTDGPAKSACPIMTTTPA